MTNSHTNFPALLTALARSSHDDDSAAVFEWLREKPADDGKFCHCCCCCCGGGAPGTLADAVSWQDKTFTVDAGFKGQGHYERSRSNVTCDLNSTTFTVYHNTQRHSYKVRLLWYLYLDVPFSKIAVSDNAEPLFLRQEHTRPTFSLLPDHFQITRLFPVFHVGDHQWHWLASLVASTKLINIGPG